MHRALAAWALIMGAETVHGVLRGVFLVPVVGELRARQISVAIGSAIIFAIAWALARWIGVRSLREQLTVGAVWVALTVCFEYVLGRLLGFTTDRLLADYDPWRGGFMLLGLAFMLLAPALAARVRG